MSPLWIRWDGCKFLVISSCGVYYLLLGGAGGGGSGAAPPVSHLCNAGPVEGEGVS